MQTCFVIAPIGNPGTETRKRSDQVLKQMIEPAARTCGYEALRADQIAEPGIITSQVLRHLLNDPMAVADLTGQNPNVYYELAIRHAVRKPIVQIISRGEPIPFDVAPMRTIPFDLSDPDSVKAAEYDLIRQITAQQVKKDPIQTPLSVALRPGQHYFLMNYVPLQSHEDYEPFESFLKEARKVDVIGINLAGIISGHQGFIEQRAKSGCKFRFIITDPALVDSIPMSPQTKRNARNTFDLLERINRKTENVKLGLLKYTPAYSLLIRHGDLNCEGAIQVEIYSQVEVFSDSAMANQRPHFILSQCSNQYWYDYFCREFKQAWKSSGK